MQMHNALRANSTQFAHSRKMAAQLFTDKQEPLGATSPDEIETTTVSQKTRNYDFLYVLQKVTYDRSFYAKNNNYQSFFH